MKKIEVDYTVFYISAVCVTLLSWVALSVYTDAPLLVLFFPVYFFFYVLVRLCARYVFDIK